jgi:hypothetical protein
MHASSADSGRSAQSCTSRATLFLVALAAAGSSLAQTPTGTDPRPTPTPGLTLPDTTRLPPISPMPQVWIGRWAFTRTDDETGATDTTIIEFMTDGRYQAQNRNSLFPSPNNPSYGRFSIANAGPSGFDLRIEGVLKDPELDPADAVEIQHVTVLDQNTLRAGDGSIVRRIK